MDSEERRCYNIFNNSKKLSDSILAEEDSDSGPLVFDKNAVTGSPYALDINYDELVKKTPSPVNTLDVLCDSSEENMFEFLTTQGMDDPSPPSISSIEDSSVGHSRT